MHGTAHPSDQPAGDRSPVPAAASELAIGGHDGTRDETQPHLTSIRPDGANQVCRHRAGLGMLVTALSSSRNQFLQVGRQPERSQSSIIHAMH